ncbi:MAG: hypothetical protein FWD35_02445 [Oscillospiraceae bacterium]|nr:hypothetical protein [Oscillospiraceae bacterium]
MKTTAKKFTALLTAAVLLLSLTACEQLELLSLDNIDLDKAYTFSANMNLLSSGESLEAVADFSRERPGVWSVTFAEPFALSGLQMSFADGQLIQTFETAGITSHYTSSSNNSGVAVLRIITAFENAISGEGREITLEKQSGASKKDTVMRVRAGGSELLFDKESKLPLSLHLPTASSANSLTVSFSQAQTAAIIPVMSPNTPDMGDSTQVWEPWQIIPMG